jgi:hypothetical protein
LADHFTTERAKPILDLIEALLEDTDKKGRGQKQEHLRGADFGGGFRPPDGTPDRAVGQLFAGLYSPRGFVHWPVVLEVLDRVVAVGRGILGAGEAAVQAELLRCIYGHPPDVPEFDPAWRTETVLGLARGIYDERAFDRAPVLADALQDAGCDNDDILTHCRGPGPHVRGCWVLDLVLGKQ